MKRLLNLRSQEFTATINDLLLVLARDKLVSIPQWENRVQEISVPVRLSIGESETVKPNPVKMALRAGKPQVGTWLSLGSTFAARFLARTGLPWLTVDLEHTHTDIQTAALMFGAIADANCTPLARVSCCRHDLIKSVLDCGAMGIVVPMVMTPEEAQLAVAACKYPPLGNRSLGGSLHALNYGTTADKYYAGANEEILVVIQTEHIHAVERAEEIYAVPGIDAIFVGPNDLAASLREAKGVNPTPERIEKVLLRIRETADRHNVPCGIHVKDPEDAQRRIDEGWRFIAVGSELAMMLQYATELANRFQQGEAAPKLANY